VKNLIRRHSANRLSTGAFHHGVYAGEYLPTHTQAFSYNILSAFSCDTYRVSSCVPACGNLNTGQSVVSFVRTFVYFVS